MNGRQRRRWVKGSRYVDRLIIMDQRVNGVPDRDHVYGGPDMAFKITASMWGALYGMSGKAWRRHEEFNRRYPTVFLGGGFMDEKFSKTMSDAVDNLNLDSIPRRVVTITKGDEL